MFDDDSFSNDLESGDAVAEPARKRIRVNRAPIQKESSKKSKRSLGKDVTANSSVIMKMNGVENSVVLSHLDKEPKFYSKLLGAVHRFPCLYNRCDIHFRTKISYRVECWNKVAKDVNFRGDSNEIEAEWRALEQGYRNWRKEQANETENADEMDEVYKSMTWIDPGFIPWFERNPIMKAVVRLLEEHEKTAQWPSKRLSNEDNETSDVFEVPDKPPLESPVRRRTSRRLAVTFATPTGQYIDDDDDDFSTTLRENSTPHNSNKKPAKSAQKKSSSKIVCAAVFDLSKSTLSSDDEDDTTNDTRL